MWRTKILIALENFSNSVKEFEYLSLKVLSNILSNNSPQFQLGLLHLPLETSNYRSIENGAFERSNPFQSSILWGVPKHRRSKEVRRMRRIGAENYFCKLIPLKKLHLCLVCGNTHGVHELCPTCYDKVKKVTDEIKEAMLKSYGKKPIEKEYQPVFEGESVHTDNDGLHEGKLIFEVPSERPSWFSSKLTQESNVISSPETSPAFPDPTKIKMT